MNIYKRLFVVAALCSMLATTISEALVKDGYLTIGLDNSVNDNYSALTTTNAVTTAKGFDISMYCYIATTLGLRPKFVAYDNAGTLATALTDGKIDCYGGANLLIATQASNNSAVGSNDPGSIANLFYGVTTNIAMNTLYSTNITSDNNVTLNTYAYGIVFAANTVVSPNLPCALMQQVELAVNLAVSSGAYACFASRNNANVDGADALVGDLTVPTPFFSTIYGTIPASTISGTVTTYCNSCTRTQLPVTSCLVNYLLIGKNECNTVVDKTNVTT